MKPDKKQEDLMAQVISAIIQSKGFKTVACQAVGVNPRTFRYWMQNDEEFRKAVEDAVEFSREYRDDLAEQKLFSLVEAGDTTACIFYAKTRLKDRGYTDKRAPKEQPQAHEQPQAQQLPAETIDPKVMKRKVESKKQYIVKLLKQEGKYTTELSMQVKIVAQLLVKTDLLADEIFASDHRSVNIETSREGDARESISPKEKLYLDYLQQSQKALRALGMNTDSKAAKQAENGLQKFLEQFGEGDVDEQ